MAILSKGSKPDNIESHNSIKLSFYKYLWPSLKFYWMWIFPWIKLSWHSSSMWDKLGESIDSGNFSATSYLYIIWKDSITHMYGLAVYVNEGFPFAWYLSLENSYLCFRLAWLHLVSYFFFLYWSPSLSLCTIFWFYSSYIDDVLSINPPANVFVFGDFNVHHKNWLTYSDGTDRAGELYYNFSIENELTQMVNFPTGIYDSDCQSCSFGLISIFCC